VERIPAGRRDSSRAPLKVPHMGWNDVVPGRVPHPLLAGGPTPYYFVHSYHAVPRELEWVAGIVEYGERALVAAVARKNVFAVQFHPEKSQRAGLELLERFVGWSP
jgi:glutamine amidotransferase